MKTFIFRVLAFSLDIFLVFMASSLIGLLNPNKDEIYTLYQKLDNNKILYQDILNNYKTIIEDDNISYEESIIIINKYSYYAKNFLNGNLSKTIEDDLYNTYQNKKNNIEYQISKKRVFNYYVYIIVSVIYFGFIAYFLKGQTLFKKVFKLRIIYDKKLSLLNMIIRSILISGLIFALLNIIFVNILNENSFILFTNILNIIKIIYPLVFIIFLIFKDDNKSIHDYLLKTKVLSYNKSGLIESKMFK